MPVHGLVTTYTIPENAVEIDKEFFELKMPDTPILNLIGEGKRISSTKLEWWDDVPLPFAFDLASAHTSGDNTLTFSTDDAKLIKIGHILKYNDIIFRVTTVNTSTGAVTVTVVSGDDADISQGATIELISDAALEASEYTDSGILTAVKRENVTQIFTEFLKFSGTQLAVDLEYNANLLAKETRKKMKKLRVLLEKTVINGVLVDPSDNTTPRMMKGILEFIKDNGYTTSATFSEANFNAFLEQVYYLRQNRPITAVYMHPKTKENFNALLSDKIVVAPTDKVAGTVKSTYISQWGEVELRTAPHIPLNKILVIEEDMIKVRPLRPMVMWELPKNGDYSAYMMLGEYTLEVRNSASMGLLTLS